MNICTAQLNELLNLKSALFIKEINKVVKILRKMCQVLTKMHKFQHILVTMSSEKHYPSLDE